MIRQVLVEDSVPWYVWTTDAQQNDLMTMLLFSVVVVAALGES